MGTKSIAKLNRAVLLIIPALGFLSGCASSTSSDAPKVMAVASARHILTETEEECAGLKKQIEEGADFAELAKQYSRCPSGAKGGDLGTFNQGKMVKEFDEVVFSAPIGEVQGPVKTKFGYHLVEVTERPDVSILNK